MNPEDTDKFKSLEDVLYRLGDVPKKDVDEPEKAKAPERTPSDKSSDDASEDPKA